MSKRLVLLFGLTLVLGMVVGCTKSTDLGMGVTLESEFVVVPSVQNDPTDIGPVSMKSIPPEPILVPGKLGEKGSRLGVLASSLSSDPTDIGPNLIMVNYLPDRVYYMRC